MASTVAAATINAVPMICGAMPPPAPNAGGFFVRKSMLSTLAPFLMTE